MACGCSGSSTPAREARQQARNGGAAPPNGASAPRGVNSPGYFYTGPKKRADQAKRAG